MTDTEYEMSSIKHDAEDANYGPHAADSQALLTEALVTHQPLAPPATLPRWATWEIVAVAVFDSFMVVLSAVFLALAFVAKFLDGRTVTQYPYGQTVIAFTRYGVTLYPILFAAVTSRTLQLLAIWLAERGEKLGILEQLLGSVTMFGTLKTQYMLRAVNISAITLILLWSLSPLGGQATLRVLSTTTLINSTSVPVIFFNTSALGITSQMANAVPGLLSTTVDSIYNSALIAPPQVQSSPHDSWGNVKVPMLEKLDSSKADSEGWIPVPIDQPVAYTSLIGLPIIGIPPQGNTTFQTISSYFHLDCIQPVQKPPDQEFQWPELNKELNDICGTNGTWKFGSIPGSSSFGIGSLTNNSGLNFVGINNTWRGPFATQPRTLIVQSSLTSFGRPISVTNCTVTYPTVETRIFCLAGNCSATHIRSSPSLFPVAQTPLEDCNNAKYFYEEFVFSAGVQRPYHYQPSVSPNEVYIFYGSEGAVDTAHIIQNLTQLNATIISERLDRLVNTYWLASALPNFIVAGGLANGFNVSSLAANYAVNYTTTQVVTALDNIYVCDNIWLGILVLSSVILCVCGITSTILRVFNVSPDVFGYVSTLTRDNPLVPQGYGGSTLDGSARARLMKDVKVRLGDVEPEKDIGHIGLANIEVVHVEKLRKNKFYD